MLRYATLDSPVGRLLFVGHGEVLSRLHMQDPATPIDVAPGYVHDPDAFLEAREQMASYFAGELMEFEVETAAEGTPFQHKVWDALKRIPYGQTASYGDIARQIGMPTASRAVGAANGKNPLGIIVPCHRVIGSSGKLTGYAGGLDRKKKLLDLEAMVTSRLAP